MSKNATATTDTPAATSARGSQPDAAKRRQRKASPAARKKAQSKPKAKNKPTARTAKKTAKAASALDAAARVLSDTKQPMGCKEMVEVMLAKGWWSTKGKTPAATLYAAMIREIRNKGKESRFRKAERGRFVLNTKRT